MFYERPSLLYDPPHARGASGSGNFLCTAFRRGMGRRRPVVPCGMGSGAQHTSAIFQAVRKVLDSLEGRRLAEIVVGSGPGSYGGIRVALAVADGLSLVHGSRVAAFSSWNGLGIHAPLACVMSDARRGGWAWARVTAGVLEGSPEVLPGSRPQPGCGNA